jgi:NAD(P)H-dependent FMN reductase
MNIHVITSSANSQSLSRALAQQVVAAIRATGATCHVWDIRDLPPTWCDGRSLADYPAEYGALHQQLRQADGVIWAVPIYGAAVSGASKNVLDIIGDAFSGKPVAVVSAAGGPRSYLAIKEFMIAMVFEFRAYLFPYTVQIHDAAELEAHAGRIDEFATNFVAMVTRLAA